MANSIPAILLTNTAGDKQNSDGGKLVLNFVGVKKMRSESPAPPTQRNLKWVGAEAEHSLGALSLI